MRRITPLALCSVFVLAIGYGCFVVAAAAMALMDGISQALLAVVVVLAMFIPMLIALAMIGSGADWFMFVQVARRLVEALRPL